MALTSMLNWNNDGWRNWAACQHTDAELFFPTGNTGVAVEYIEAAKAVCNACPVKDPCLQFAFETNQESGIWGGRDEDERRRLRKAWRAQRRACAT